MAFPRRTRIAIASTIGCVLFLLLLSYVSGYFFLSETYWSAPPPWIGHRAEMTIEMRVFSSSELAKVFTPAARVESVIRGYDHTIMTGTHDDFEEFWRTRSP